jgi:hypothetical protein
MIPADNMEFDIELNADDGDSVLSQPRSVTSEDFFVVSSPDAQEDSSEIDMSNYKSLAFQVEMANVLSPIKMEIYASINGSSFIKVDEVESSSSIFMDQENAPYKTYKLVYKPQSNTAGSIAVSYIKKG